MKDVKDFDLKQFVPEGSTNVASVIGGGARQSKRSVSSEQSELTKRSEAAGQTSQTPLSEAIEEMASTETSEQTRPIEEIVPTPTNEHTAKSRQTASISVTDQSVPSRQTTLSQTQPTPTPPSRVSSRQRRASLDEYREMFLAIPKISDRQPVFVSRDVRDKIDGVVRRLGERKMSVSGFLENLARHHLDLYADDLEQWKRL